MLWRRWLGSRKGIRPVKKIWAVGCWHGYLSGVKCRLAFRSQKHWCNWPWAWLPRKLVFCIHTCINREKCIYWGQEQKTSNGWHNKQCLEYFLAISSHHIARNYWNISIITQQPLAFLIIWKVSGIWHWTTGKVSFNFPLKTSCISHPTEFSESATYRAKSSVSSTTTGFIWLCVSSTSAGTASLLTEHVALDSSS